MIPVERIKEYKKLFDEGIITEEEYEHKRRELLGLGTEPAVTRSAGETPDAGQTELTPEPAGLVRCIKCGKEYSRELSVCPHCNYEPVLIKCSDCGTIISKKDQACSYCGCPVSPQKYTQITKEEADGLYDSLVEGIEQEEDAEKLKEKERMLLAFGDYREAAERSEECRKRYAEIEHEEFVQSRYKAGCELLESGFTYQNCVKAREIFAGISNAETAPEDVEQRIAECQQVIDFHKKKLRKRILTIAGIVVGVIAAIFVIILIASPCTILGHKYESKITKEPTCGQGGIRTYTCTVCGDSYTNPTAPTGEHEWSDWETVKKATYDSTGLKERTCKVCGETESETIEKKERPASYYKDKTIIDTDGKMLKKVYVTDGYIYFNGSFSGSGNFIVEVLDSNQDLEELVCNEIGSYYLDKTVYVGTGWHYIEILCGTGTWEMTWYGTGGD